MIRLFKNWFSKEDNKNVSLPKDEKIVFILKLEDIALGELKCEEGKWIFKYTDEFKHQREYSKIVGFPDLDKEYHSESLWPFFLIRIPGLKQPAVQEIIESENLDQENEAVLLKRFGRKTIANPYELLPA